MNKKVLISLAVIVGLVVVAGFGYFLGGKELMGSIRRSNKVAYSEVLTKQKFVQLIEQAGKDATYFFGEGAYTGEFGKDLMQEQITRETAVGVLFWVFFFDGSYPYSYDVSPTFSDVSFDHPRYKEIETFAALGVFEVSKGKFSPDAYLSTSDAKYWINKLTYIESPYLTRGQLTKLLVDYSPYLDLLPFPENPTYSDVSKNNPYTQYIYSVSEQGILSGYSDGMFHPDNVIAKAELAKAFYLAFNLSDDKLPKTSTFSDVKVEEWFFPYVEALNKTGVLDNDPYVTKNSRISKNYFYPANSVFFAEAELWAKYLSKYVAK
ncbi:S-layer homology domain-containing protein [Candidatus Gracilibacteria bacterium]|nr:S-layer homology domain-containing protein [Candidatus Gracilibacteria bacterium]